MIQYQIRIVCYCGDILYQSMLQQPFQPPSLQSKFRKPFLFMIALSCATLMAAVALVIVMALQNVSGVGTAPFVLSSCTNSYYSSKYSQLQSHLLIMFVPAVLSIIISFLSCIVLFWPLVRRQQPTFTRLQIIYLLRSFQILSIILTFSKVLTFTLEFGSMVDCKMDYVSIFLVILLALSAASLFFSIMQLGICFRILHLNEDQQEKIKLYNQLQNTTFGNLQLEDRSIEKKANVNNSFDILQPSLVISQNKLLNDVVDANISHSKHQIINNENTFHKREHFPQIQPSSINPNYNRANSIEEESFKSLMKEDRVMLSTSNRPGPILTSKVLEKDKRSGINTEGYMSYLRKMNNQNNKHETQGQLIATIRGKYKR